MDVNLLRQSIKNASVLTYSRSGGHGGQNVNKVNTKVTLRLNLTDITGLTEAELSRVRVILANRINANDEIVINADEERSQNTNQERAFSRIEALIAGAARLPKLRRPTKPPKAARENRLQSKRLHSMKKARRRMRSE